MLRPYGYLWLTNLKTAVKENMAMIFPVCQSTNIKKNGQKRGEKIIIVRIMVVYLLIAIRRSCYPDHVKQHCLHLYVEGQGLRRIERLTGVCQNTVINWIKSAALSLSEQPDQEISEVNQIDELQTYIGKKNQIWLWTPVNKGLAGI
jgi:transposase-like protein